MGVVIDKDLGWRRVIRDIRKLSRKKIAVGILEDAGKGGDGEIDLVDIAVWNEYGTRRAPARPFVRIGTDKNAEKWGGKIQEAVGAIIDGHDIDSALDAVGGVASRDIQVVMGDGGLLKPNAAATVKKKGFNLPLIETGLMESKVSHRIDG